MVQIDTTNGKTRNGVSSCFRWSLLLFLAGSTLVGYVSRSAGDTAKAAADGSPAPAGASSSASPNSATSAALAAAFKTPDDYLNLMSSNPATLPAVEQPIATALNKILVGLKEIDDAQREVEKDFQGQAVDVIQAPKDVKQLEAVKNYALQLKEVSAKREAFYKGVQPSLENDLKSAGAPDDMVSKVPALFVQRSGIESGITRSAAVEKAADDLIAYVTHLQQNKSKWTTNAQGKMTFSDREAMNKTNALIQKFDADLQVIQPPITTL